MAVGSVINLDFPILYILYGNKELLLSLWEFVDSFVVRHMVSSFWWGLFGEISSRKSAQLWKDLYPGRNRPDAQSGDNFRWSATTVTTGNIVWWFSYSNASYNYFYSEHFNLKMALHLYNNYYLVHCHVVKIFPATESLLSTKLMWETGFPRVGQAISNKTSIFFWLWFNLHYLSARAQGRSGTIYMRV